MAITNSILKIAGLFVAMILAGCQPHDAPPDLMKTQREGLDNAKALEAQLQQQAEARMKAADEAQK